MKNAVAAQEESMRNTRRQFLKTAAGALGAGLSYRFVMAEGAAYPSLPDASPEKLPRWRGFNLLNYFMEHNQYPFEERVFRGIADFGFNFVRLPLDYRCWIVDGDWNRIHSEKIDAVLRALRFGEQYSIHVMLNFHRAPGYTVAQPAEKKPLWTDPEAQDVCCRHWAEFARRCKGIPNSHLSFNLFNEPMAGEEEEVLPATIRVIEAIRAEDPDRLICCDGIRWGRRPIPGLIPYKVAQATRGYDPMDITHYKAEWVDSKSFLEPSWPLMGANGLLVSPQKSEVPQKLHRPLTIEGPFEGGERLRIKVQTVSNIGLLVVEADGKEIFRRRFTPGKGEAEWKEEHWTEWNIWQNLYDMDVFADIPAGTRELTVRNTEGDWITISELGLTAAGGEDEAVFPMRMDWLGESGTELAWDRERGWRCSVCTCDRKWLWERNIRPWMEISEKGVGVMVGEFGVISRTPHDIALRWLEDNLINWQEAGFGWAMWNWNGSFGVADSGRTDAEYEDKYGWRIDKKMMDLLQRY